MEDKPKQGITNFVYFVALITALAGLLFGYDTGVISGAILFLKKQFCFGSFVEEAIVSSVLIGAILGSILSGSIADKFGRKRTILLTAVLFAFGSIGASLSDTVSLLMTFRVIIGIAIGIASFTAPLYISEISPAKIRGGMVSLNQLMITCGIVLSYLIDYIFSANEQWRWMFAFGAVPAICLFAGMFFMPESPRWLVFKNRVKKARTILKSIRGHVNCDKELSQIIDKSEERQAGWAQVFKPEVMPAVLIGIGLAFFQQATGINTVIYYAPTIFELAGFESVKVSILATTGVGLVNVAMTVVAIRLVDRVGRRPLLFVGLSGMTASLLLLSLSFAGYLPVFQKSITMIAMVLYIAFFAISLGPIFWLLISEIYPLKIRGRAMSLATMANWTFNFLVASTFLTLIETLGKSGVFLLYSGISIIGLILCYFFIPETKGKTLEEIEEDLIKNKGLFKSLSHSDQ